MNNNDIKRIIKKYDISLEDGMKNAIDEIDNKQYACVSDGCTTYRELEKLRVWVYLQYAQEYLENNK